MRRKFRPQTPRRASHSVWHPNHHEVPSPSARARLPSYSIPALRTRSSPPMHSCLINHLHPSAYERPGAAYAEHEGPTAAAASYAEGGRAAMCVVAVAWHAGGKEGGVPPVAPRQKPTMIVGLGLREFLLSDSQRASFGRPSDTRYS
ncbi:hypothetical protein EJ06DRAFT_124580 [Trichodelitschia bisporula]|uniref:Uncharacterized protein n=1 Tax=Trichodelitschia bisporula TaxID=703511 RepID=A0A6G1HQ03_9PEZI|nr:hypothetical protein EJ06DRAFT_124580 [Trichodelitschia bisporula]